MIHIMICKQQRREEERFWFFQKRTFVMSVSEKQIMSSVQEFYMEM